MRRLLFGLLAVTVLSGARAEACAYDVYRPAMITRILLSTLWDAGVGITRYGADETRLPAGGSYLLRDNQIWGALRFTDDVRAGTSELVVADAEGVTIARVAERTAICPPETSPVGAIGRCKLTEITTELDQLAMSPPPFSMVLDPFGRQHTLRYGKPMLAHDWRGQLGETVRWLQNVVTHPRQVRAVAARNTQEAIFFSLASDALVAPYVHRLSYFFDGTYWVVTGRVPSNEVYVG